MPRPAFSLFSATAVSTMVPPRPYIFFYTSPVFFISCISRSTSFTKSMYTTAIHPVPSGVRTRDESSTSPSSRAKHVEKWHPHRSRNCSTTSTLLNVSRVFLKSNTSSFASFHHVGICPRGNSTFTCPPPDDDTCRKKTRQACIINGTSSTLQNLMCTMLLLALLLVLFTMPLPRTLPPPPPLASCPLTTLVTTAALSHGETCSFDPTSPGAMSTANTYSESLSAGTEVEHPADGLLYYLYKYALMCLRKASW